MSCSHWLDDERIGDHFPDVFDFVVAAFEVLGDALHDLVAAVGTADYDDVCAAVLELLLLVAGVPCGLVLERSGPHAAACAAAVVFLTIGGQFNEIVHALLKNPAGFVKVALAEVALEFAAVLAGIVEGELLSGMNGLVELDAALFDEFHEVIVEVDETDFIVRVYGMSFSMPFRQP